jgi:hypothetical protein
MALLRLAHAEKDQYQAQGYNLQAACLLSHYIKSCPDDRQASLFLTKIYSHMGLGSLVLRQYSALRIKEMMHDSQSHVAYSRISTTYPFPTHTFPSPEPAPKGTAVDPDPYVRIENVVSCYSDFVDDINHCLCNIEDLSFHDRMADFRELRESYERSFTKQLLALERRRIVRLSDRPADTRDFEDIGIHSPPLSSANRTNLCPIRLLAHRPLRQSRFHLRPKLRTILSTKLRRMPLEWTQT